MRKPFWLYVLLIVLFLVSVPASGSEREEFFSMDGKKLWSLGINIGTAFATPLLILNVNATIAPLPYSFIELGYEAGFIKGMAGENVVIRDVLYSSNYFYGRLNTYLKLGKTKYDSYGRPKPGGGWYLGLGLGVMNAQYAYILSDTERTVATVQTPTLDGGTGFLFGRSHILFKAMYGIRTSLDMNNLIGVNHRFLLGVTYRIY